MALEFEHLTAGFEAINYGALSGEQVAQDAVAAMSHYYFGDDASLARIGSCFNDPFSAHRERKPLYHQ